MLTYKFAILDKDNRLVGVTNDSEEALTAAWSEPGWTAAPMDDLRFDVIHDGIAENPAQYEAIKRLWTHGHKSSGYNIPPFGPSNAPSPKNWTAFWQFLISEGIFPDKKILAIKECRTRYGIGLAEAKAVIDTAWTY